MDPSTRDFLAGVADILRRLERESVRHDRPLMASLLGLARDEAEDDLRTSAAVAQALSDFQKAGRRKQLPS
jgi:hypothetical protein